MSAMKQLLRAAWVPRGVWARRMASLCTSPFMTMLENYPAVETSTLSSGLRIVSEYRDVQFAAIGLFFTAGSRCEVGVFNGSAYLFEHMVWKGTANRSRKALEAQMTCTGAKFKTITERELVGFYAECLLEDVPLIVDILADCVFCSSLDEKEFEKQKQLMYREMEIDDVDTSQVLFDYLHGAAFNGTTLGQPISGSIENLCSLTDEMIKQHQLVYYDPPHTVLAAVGAVPHQCIHDLAAVYLSHVRAARCEARTYRFTAADFRYRNDDVPYAHVALGFEAPSFCDADAYLWDICTAAVGGWDCSMPGGILPASYCARVAGVGLGHGYKSFYHKYTDCGLWGVEYVAPKLEADDMMHNVQQQLMKLCLTITEEELERAKNEYMTYLLTMTDNLSWSLVDLARWTLYNGCRPTLAARVRMYEEVNLGDVKAACMTALYDRPPAMAAVGNIEVVPDYIRVIQSQHWSRV